MMDRKKIALFWWSEIYLMNKKNENYGDLLGKYLVEKITHRTSFFKHTKKKHFLDQKKVLVTIGSILANVNERCIVWGSGIISKEYNVKNADFRAVRGPQTRAFLIEKGYVVPEIYGDPALLLPLYYKPKREKKFKLGVIPHYSDYELVKEWYKDDDHINIINLMTLSIESTTDEILKCEKIVSSSLHGIIVAHAYGIPAVWQKFSTNLFGDNIKFQDYFESVLITSYVPPLCRNKLSLERLNQLFIETTQVLPDENVLEGLVSKLLKAFPEEFLS